jgi:hypothetical protein
MFMRATLGFEQETMREGLIPRSGSGAGLQVDIPCSCERPIPSRVLRLRAAKTSVERPQRIPIAHISPRDRICSQSG